MLWLHLCVFFCSKRNQTKDVIKRYKKPRILYAVLILKKKLSHSPYDISHLISIIMLSTNENAKPQRKFKNLLTDFLLDLVKLATSIALSVLIPIVIYKVCIQIIDLKGHFYKIPLHVPSIILNLFFVLCYTEKIRKENNLVQFFIYMTVRTLYFTCLHFLFYLVVAAAIQKCRFIDK